MKRMRYSTKDFSLVPGLWQFSLNDRTPRKPVTLQQDRWRMVPASMAESSCYCQPAEAAGKVHELLFQGLLPAKAIHLFSLCLGLHSSLSCQLDMSTPEIHQIPLMSTVEVRQKMSPWSNCVHCVEFLANWHQTSTWHPYRQATRLERPCRAVHPTTIHSTKPWAHQRKWEKRHTISVLPSSSLFIAEPQLKSSGSRDFKPFSFYGASLAVHCSGYGFNRWLGD